MKEVKKFMNVKAIIRHIRKGDEVKVNSVFNEFTVGQKELDKALFVLQAERFVNDYKEKNGNKALLCERLRDGYIGEVVHCTNGSSYIQSVRGKPFGTIVAIKNGDDVSIGISYVDPEDMEEGFPIVGEYLALQRALFAKENNFCVDKKNIKSKAHKQIEHFTKRALAFFIPEKYSYSRGTTPVEYENFNEIKARREAILNCK